jgi:hypothetical protein
LHPRFDLRVFTDEERWLIEAAAVPERARWALWAAKESAFKVAKKLHDEIPFHPKSFAVRWLEDARAEVRHRVAGCFQVWVEEARDWIHAVAAPAAEALARPTTAVEVVEEQAPLPGRLGEMARDLARRAVAPFFSLEAGDLTVILRDRIPHLSLRGRVLPVDLSLSHHGRVVGCAWTGDD